MQRSVPIILTILLILSFFRGEAQQIKKFTEEPEAYLDEVKDLFSRSENNSSKGKDLLKEFEQPWLNGFFNPDRQRRVYEISNLLIAKKARTFPHIYDYIEALLTFANTPTDSANYNNWEASLKYVLTDPKSRISDISTINNSIIHLLIDHALYYSPTAKWISDNNQFTIDFINDTLTFRFEHLNLTCFLRNDSIRIEETSGICYPLDNIWKGNNAIVYWDKAGITKDTARAEIDSYTLNLSKPLYSIPKVQFYNKTYFDYPIIGTLSDKVVEGTKPESMSYPRFDSDEKHFEIKGLFNDIDYRGGFLMHGAKFLGSGDTEQPATLSLYRDTEVIKNGDTLIEKRLFMKTFSSFYAFRKNSIVSRNTKISIYIDKDSIYHPGLLFKYYDWNREIDLIRDNDPENMSRSPYFDTYHMIDLDFELLTWKMNEPKVNITMLKGTSINIAKFESANYFSASRYYEVQGLEDIHPYIMLRNFARKNDTQYFHAEDFAKYYKQSMTTIRHLLIELTFKGIVDYDFETEYCRIKPRLYEYLDAVVGRRDYDLINFESRTNAPLNNATLDLKNMDLIIEGVPMINVSDSQNVIFYPKNEKILLKKNRDFDFGGSIEAGLFKFYGDNFQFKYDSFKIVLNKIDSLSLQVESGIDNWGRRKLTNVANVIEDVSGDLEIDDPHNKSGVKSFPSFPIFASNKNSFVYYDASYIRKGKYTRDKFYFLVYPYSIDSLNNFSTEGMGYEGELYSSDIFQVIKEKLVLQPDNSLGFVHNTPEQGLPIYQGKGKYLSKISLSNHGLEGKGTLNYLTSTTTSDDFVFYPDSTNAYTTSFNIARQLAAVQYPEVKADKIDLHWMPYRDKLTASVVENPMVMYEDKSKLKGSLFLTPLGLTGNGEMNYYGSQLASNFITFKTNNFSTDTASFTLNSVNPDQIAFKTDNVNAKVSFTDMKSSFRSNDGTSKVDLPENQYIAYIEKFDWLMDKKSMQLNTPNTVQVFERGKTRTVLREEAGLSAKGSLFVSVHPQQDSLNWVSPIADFNLATNTISAHEVKYIEVADAMVFPDSGEVIIEQKAQIKTLQKAKVLANTTTKYHNFHDANINITSRNLYQGQGQYDYYNELGQIEPINFDVISVDSIGQTYANGKIKGIEDFSLSPAFRYQGKVQLKAQNKNLAYDGYFRINNECTQIEKSWVKFAAEIDPNNIYIPIDDQPKDINDNFLVSGVLCATDSVHVFPAFLSPRKRYSNRPVITTSGYLVYDSKEKKYKIGSKERIANNDTTGNFLSLHKNICNLYGEGNIDLTAELGQVKIESEGNANYLLENDKLNLDLIMTIDFFFPEACIKFLGDTLSTMTGLKPISLNYRTYTKGITEWLGYKEADQLMKEQSIFGTVKKVPDKLSTTFVLSELNMVWNKDETAWQSVGDIGVVNVLGKQINRKIKGNLEIQRKRSGDSFTLYFELSKDHWYFFRYKRGLMQAYSSEKAFNDVIAGVKGGDRKKKIQQGESSYVFFLSDEKKRNDFLKHLSGQKVNEDEDKQEEENDQKRQQYEDFD